jgi:hypothetical protein
VYVCDALWKDWQYGASYPSARTVKIGINSCPIHQFSSSSIYSVFGEFEPIKAIYEVFIVSFGENVHFDMTKRVSGEDSWKGIGASFVRGMLNPGTRKSLFVEG